MSVAKLVQENYFPCAPAKEVERIWRAFTEITSRMHPQGPQLAAAYQHHYGLYGQGGVPWAATRAGAEGELTALTVNSASPYVKAKVSLVTASQVEWAVKTKQDSAASTLATNLSRSLLENEWESGGLAELDVEWEETSQVQSAGYVFVEWDRTRGPDAMVDAEAGVVKKAGDCRANLLSPLFVATDPNLDSARDEDWWFLGLARPKSDLVYLYNKLADGREGDDAAQAILDAKVDGWRRQQYRDVSSLRTLATVVHFIHRPTLALPFGRHVVMLSSDVVLRDTSLTGPDGDYEMVPVIRRASEEQLGTAQGYTRFYDTLGPQDILDGLHTTQASIISTFGNPVFAMEEGTNMEPQDVATFGRSMKVPREAKMPGYILPPGVDESTMKYGQELKDAQQQSMALNDAALGQPQTAERNAQAEALFASMAVQQAGPAVLARRRSLSLLGQVWLTTLRKNVSTKRLARMTGASQANLRADVKEWTGTDLGPLDSVEVEEVSPEAATIQGRWGISEKLLEMGVIKTAEELEQVRTTGRLNRAVDPVRDENALVQEEYELLSQGKEILVHPTHNQPLHYRGNAAVLLSRTALEKKAVRDLVQKTLDLRYEMYFGVPPGGAPPSPENPMGAPPDPLRLDRQRFLLGQGPLPAPPMAGGMPGAPGAGAPAGPEQPMPSSSPGAEMQGAPTNPLTQQPFSPAEAPVQ